ncbi:MAG: alpha/beta hydrolase fold domain-containing protein [Sciscionella sp.]
MPVDPILREVLAAAPPLVPDGASPQQVRETLAELAANPDLAELAPEVASVSDRAIHGQAGEIPVRIYRPDGDGPLPVVVFFHGGGWVIGSLETHDGVCREFCTQAEAVVVSVDYRLAPEHAFPAGLHDCLAVTRWVLAHAAELDGDPTRVVVAGDSAGGNFATVIAQQLAGEDGAAPSGQLLIYPATDMSTDYPSREEFAQGYFLDQEALEWFITCYVTDPASVLDPRMSPVLHPKLSEAPPAVVVTAEYDPIRDQGNAYAEALAAAGVPVQTRQFAGLVHGFLHFGAFVPAAKAATDEICALLRKLLEGTSTQG